MEVFVGLVVLVLLAVPVVLLVFLLIAIGNLRGRVAALEVAVSRTTAAGMPAAWAASPAPAAPPARAAPPATAPARPDPPAPAPEPARPAAPPPAAAMPGAAGPRRPLPPPPPPPAPNPVERFAAGVRRWFTEGNVPVKVGVLVLLAGVAALLRYASSQGWLSLPVGLRLAVVAAAALLALAFAWRRRRDHRSFSLAVQGGAIGVLLLVVYAAFRLYGLLDAGAAFALSVGLVAAVGVLAVLQDSRTLAVLGILAGFLAPLWLSSGSGHHVVLFSYYALLNAAILAVAWLRPWRELNLLGFVFTWGIGVAWGALSYTPAKYASTQPFLLLFFAFYLALPLLYARRRVPGRRDVVDASLVFGTPLVAFLLQGALLEWERRPLALCALALAALYAALAWWQRRGPHVLLGQAYALLAAGFATLAVPLALAASATSAVFAVEGAALVWLGVRTARALPQWSGSALQLGAAFAFVFGSADWPPAAAPFANPAFAGALLVALAGFASAWCWRGAGRTVPALLAYVWALAWWCGNALHEAGVQLAPGLRPAGLVAAAAATALLASVAHRWRPAPVLGLTVAGAMATAIGLAFVQAGRGHALLAGWNGAAWAAFAVAGALALRGLRAGGGAPAAWAQSGWWFLWALVLALAIDVRLGGTALGAGWRIALPLLPWLALAALLAWRRGWLRWPLGADADRVLGPLAATTFAVIALGWLRGLASAGGSEPMAWVPVANPLDLAQLAALALFARWLWDLRAGPAARALLLAPAGFLLATCMTLRGVHHWGGVPWGDALWSSSLGQLALTLAWSILGVAGWIAGSRRGQRALWLAGAVLMAVVLAKLVLVDRQHLGGPLGIGSFIGYGLLCMVVGWFAPAPPRSPAAGPAAAATAGAGARRA